MGRRDLASLLGVAHETVSRSFTALSMAGLIAVNDRDIEILDPLGLQAYARNTRRAQEDARYGPAMRPGNPLRQTPTPARSRRSMYLA
jgi:CRP/FNR family transcriptional regulator